MKPDYLRLAIAATLLAAGAAHAADEPAKEESKGAISGLPEGTEANLQFSAGWGFFGFGNSLFANSHDEVTQDLSSNWMEGYVKGGVDVTHKLSNGSEIYGALTGVGERTWNAPPPLVGGEASSFGAEDAYIGWRSGSSLGLGENAVDFVVGRTQYKLGHGMLVYDGGSEGGSRGGFWSGARKAFEFAAVGRVKAGPTTIEGFYLDRDELPENDSDSKAYGINFEFSWNEDNTVGATYASWSANQLRPERDGMDLINLRAYLTPIASLKALSFEFEYAMEDNGDLIDSTAWNAQVGWQLETAWQPKITYRYAVFEGDDPNSTANEAFDGLWTGFYDWSSWWQGEIAGEYFASNSNLITNTIRVHAKPNDAIGTGLILLDFHLDNTASAGVTSDNLATELDWYTDWQVNDNFLVSFVAAYAHPGQAVIQGFGRDEDFYYGMLYIGYTY
jgi:alginate export protein